MSKHTEGPWRRGGIDKMYILDPNDNAICSVWSDHDDKEEDKANARLIAAAPELIAVLQGYLAAHDTAAEKGKLSLALDAGFDLDLMGQARAAIDKAKAIVRGTANGKT